MLVDVVLIISPMLFGVGAAVNVASLTVAAKADYRKQAQVRGIWPYPHHVWIIQHLSTHEAVGYISAEAIQGMCALVVAAAIGFEPARQVHPTGWITARLVEAVGLITVAALMACSHMYYRRGVRRRHNATSLR